MGTDHAIIIAWGYRIPVKNWNGFKQLLEETAELSKRRRVDEDGDSYEEMDFDAEYFIGEIEGHNERPETHGFADQSNCGDDEGYVLIYDLGEDYQWLMDRKIGGALAWTTQGFRHMQNVPSLSFSVQLEHRIDDDEEERRTAFLAELPEQLADFLRSLDVTLHYNRWLFSYAW